MKLQTALCREGYPISSHLTSISSDYVAFSVVVQLNPELVIIISSFSANSLFIVFSFFPLLASAQRPEEVIQRYMEEVTTAPDEVDILTFLIFEILLLHQTC